MHVQPAISAPSDIVLRERVDRFLDRLPARKAPDAARMRDLSRRLRRQLREHDATLVAHYYTHASIQDLAADSGGCVADSLEMARFGRDCPSSTLVVAGVRFMGETAKILSPEKRVLMPTLEATCSLDLGCPPEEFAAFRAAHPDRLAVVYANTSAAVKAQSDWVVTSANAEAVIEHLTAQGEKLLWAPDRHLGDYIRRRTGADMKLWPGACIVHEEFKARGLRDLQHAHPQALTLAHPESPAAVLERADRIGSTSALLRYAAESPAREFIVATDAGLLHQMRRRFPDRRFIEAPTAGAGATCRSCGRCPWMAMNDLDKVSRTLDERRDEIVLDAALIEAARRPLRRMLEFNGV